MQQVGIRELKQHTSQVLRRVRERKEAVAITLRGRVVARLIPIEEPARQRAKTAKVWADMDTLAQEIGAQWPAGVSATQAVSEQRRDL